MDQLFEWIETEEEKRNRPWGRILDAGTGHHSLEWLVQCKDITEIIAVTGEQGLATELQQMYEHVRVYSGNWMDHTFLEHESSRFDVILAGLFHSFTLD